MTNSRVPELQAFFASEAGVCVYVTIGHEVVRVCFESPQAPGSITDSSGSGRTKALAVAREVFQAHRAELLPLFEKVESTRAKRAGQ